jgi:cytochrome P450 family 49 subfamily A
VLSNKEDYFPDPDKFIPERWIKNGKDSQRDIHRFVSLPFGYGRRTCLGRRFAEAEMAILLSKVSSKKRRRRRRNFTSVSFHLFLIHIDFP